MNRSVSFCAVVLALALGAFPLVSRATDYAGNYEGAEIAVVLAPAGAAYAGEIRKGGQTFPLTAHEDGNHLTGAFTVGRSSFAFTASQQGNDLTLTSGAATYQLHRSAAPNPLDTGQPPAAAPANPLPANPAAPVAGAAPQATDALADYVVMNRTDVGRSLMHELPNAKTTRAALQATFPDLARFFGARPTILGAYEDQKDHRSAFVSFSTQLNGQPIKGFVTTKLREKGAVAFVVYGRENATREEWARLTAAPGSAQAAGGAGPVADERDLKTQMAEVPLKPYVFPDHTGAVGLAEGWTTTAQTESNLLITGPAGQRIRMALGGTVYTPDSPTVRQNPQNAARLNLAVAPYSDDPATALANVIRATSIVSQRKGGPTSTPDKLINVTPVPSKNPGGHGAQVTYDVTVTDRGAAKHFRVFIQFETSPVRNGTWGYYIFLQLIAPQETFKQDLPVMMAQAFSLNENAGAIAAKSAREIDAANKLAAAQRAANQKVADANYARIKGAEETSARQSQAQRDFDTNETLKQRAATDFDEVIRGERTIEDTRTGEKTSVNLADVHDIVDKLNYTDPGRFHEIPLRDEVYPLPGHENDRDYLAR